MSDDKLDNLIKVVLVLFIVFLIFQIIKKLRGGSWDKDDIIVALIVISLGWTFSLQKQMSAHIGEQKGYEKGLKNGKNESPNRSKPRIIKTKQK